MKRKVGMLTFWGVGASLTEGLGSPQVRNLRPQVVSKGSVRTRRDCGVVTREELIRACDKAGDNIVGLVARKTDSDRKFIEVRFVSADPQKSKMGIMDQAQLKAFLSKLPERVKIVRIYDNIGKPNLIIDLTAKVTGEEEVITLTTPRKRRAPKKGAAAG